MNVSDFVTRNIPSALKEVQQQELSDQILTVYEIALIYHYSDTGFEPLNELLIQNAGKITTDFAGFMVNTLEKLPNFQDVVFRGTQLSAIQKQRYQEAFQNNIAIIEPFFVSTSKSELIANQFSKRNTLFTIFSKTGKEIEKYAKFGIYSGQNEKEVLFKPNCNFEVLDISDSDSQTLITLEQIV